LLEHRLEFFTKEVKGSVRLFGLAILFFCVVLLLFAISWVNIVFFTSLYIFGFLAFVDTATIDLHLVSVTA